MLKFDWNAVFTLVNLIIFYLLMKKFLFGRIKKVIDKRRELLDSEFKKAEETNAEAENKLRDYENKISDYKNEGRKIIDDARENARVEYDKILDRAENDANALRADAEREIEEERQAARRASKEEIASLALQAAEKVVGKSVSADTDSAIFDEFLNESSDE